MIAIALSLSVPPHATGACLDYPTYLKTIGNLSLGGSPGKIALRPPWAFVVGEHVGFLVVDLSDPSNPRLAASLNPTGPVNDVALAGDYAYCAVGSYGFALIDIHDPEAPVPLGTVDLPGIAFGIAASGPYAAVATGTDTFYMVSVVDPLHPVVVGSLVLPGTVFDIDIEGDFAYVADEWPHGMQVVSISNPGAPRLVATYETYNLSKSITVCDHRAYIGEQLDPPWAFTDFEVVDVTNPAAPFLLDRVWTWQRVRDMAVEGGYAYLAEANLGPPYYPSFQIVDVSDPTDISVVAEGPLGLAFGVAAYDGKIVLADFMNLLKVVDVRDADPQLGTVDTPGEANDAAARGTWVYVADGPGGVSSIDASDPSYPFLASETAAPGPALGIAIAGSFACVACDDQGLAVYDLADPSAPSLVGHLDTPGPCPFRESHPVPGSSSVSFHGHPSFHRAE